MYARNPITKSNPTDRFIGHKNGKETQMNDGRNENGQFAKGNPGGPGRPRRAVEREYLIALLEKISLVDWQEVIDKTLADAKAGDARAREWLARFLLGPKPSDLAADELAGFSTEMEIAAKRTEREQDRMFSFFGESLRDDTQRVTQ
jgi:hypothetical protein